MDLRALGTTLFAVGLLAASGGARPAPASGDPVRDVLDQLPPLPVPLPPLPDLPVPGLPPLPAPVPTAAPTPAPTRSPPPAAASSTPAPAAVARPRRPAATASPRPAAVRAPARAPARRRTPAAPARRRPSTSRLVAAPAAQTRPAAAAHRPAARKVVPAGPPSFAAQVTGGVGEFVRAVPPAIWWALAGLAAIALGLALNALWQSRRRAALEAQRAVLLDDIGLLSSALLPAVPDGLDGVAVSAAYRPADGPAAGGDFYDVFTVGEASVCVLLGDVSGHGRESVTQAALARYTLRTLLAAGHRPAEALARADRLLARELRPNFVTVIAGVYDPGTGELTYAKAGHAPPIVLGAAHDPGAEEPVPPLGLAVGESWPEYRLRLGDGVSVCFFTDGLQDAMVGDARVGRAEVVRMLAAHAVPDAGQLLGDLEALADRLPDDTAAVVVRGR